MASNGKNMKTMSMFLFLDFWKGKRKDKDAPSPVADDTRPYLEAEAAGTCINCAREGKEDVRIASPLLSNMVTLPSGLDTHEWLATHTLLLFEVTNHLLSVTSEQCTNERCPTMSGPGAVQYQWQDDKEKKKQQKHSAPVYTSLAMTNIEHCLKDENYFPTKYGNEFPKDLEIHTRRIHRLLLHVLAHLYHAHYRLLASVQLGGHLNSILSHLVVFGLQYNTLEEKDLEPLSELLAQLEVLKRPSSSSSTSSSSHHPSSSSSSQPIPGGIMSLSIHHQPDFSSSSDSSSRSRPSTGGGERGRNSPILVHSSSPREPAGSAVLAS